MGQKFNPYLAGQLLLAMPHMNDPRFHKAAVLICAHDDKGAMGIVMNHTLPDLEFGQILKDLDIQSTITLPDAVSKLPVMCGGPVEIARGFLVHSNDFKHNGTIEVNESVRITATVDAIKALSDGTKPNDLVFALGYAGWTAGQLEKEIKDNAWMVAPHAHNFIFDEKPENIWDQAMFQIGVNPALLTEQSGHA